LGTRKGRRNRFWELTDLWKEAEIITSFDQRAIEARFNTLPRGFYSRTYGRILRNFNALLADELDAHKQSTCVELRDNAERLHTNIESIGLACHFMNVGLRRKIALNLFNKSGVTRAFPDSFLLGARLRDVQKLVVGWRSLIYCLADPRCALPVRARNLSLEPH
jgi:hypothetical protein